MYLIEEYEKDWLLCFREKCLECGNGVAACESAHIKCCPDCTHGRPLRKPWQQWGAFGVFSDAGDVGRILCEHFFQDAGLDLSGLIRALGRLLQGITFLAHHSETSLAAILGVSAFRDYECTGIFLGPDAAIMAGGSLAVDTGRLMNALLFHEPVYSKPREMTRLMGGIVWCVGNLALFAGCNLEALARLDNDAMMREAGLRNTPFTGLGASLANVAKLDITLDAAHCCAVCGESFSLESELINHQLESHPR